LTDGRTFMIPFGLVTSEPALAAAMGCRYRVADAHAETDAPERADRQR
jgi:hypothetical protein